MTFYCDQGHEMKYYPQKGKNGKIYYYLHCTKCNAAKAKVRYGRKSIPPPDSDNPRCQNCGRLKRKCFYYKKVVKNGKLEFKERVRFNCYYCNRKKNLGIELQVTKCCNDCKTPLKEYNRVVKYIDVNGVTRKYKSKLFRCPNCFNQKQRTRNSNLNNPICECGEVKQIFQKESRYFSKRQNNFAVLSREIHLCKKCEYQKVKEMERVYG